MKKNRVRSLLALGLSLTMMVSIMGCGKQQRLDAEINPDTPVSDVQFPLKETEELSFITSAPATSTQDPNKRVIFQRMEEQTNVHIDWTCFVSDQFSDKKNLALAQFGNLPDGLFNAGMSDYDLLRYAKQGIIIPLENLIDKYMPNLQAVFEKYPEYRTMCTAPDGHIYSFPWIEQLGSGKEAIQAIGDIPYINKKWLDYLGLEIPTTTDELEQVLIQFRDHADDLKQEFSIEGDVIPMSFIINNGDQDPSILINGFGDGYGDTGDHFAVTDEVGAKGLAWTKIDENGEVAGGIAKFITPEIKEALQTKYGVENNSAMFFIADEFEKAQKIAGLVRIELGKRLDLLEKDVYRFCFIVDFPMYELSDEGTIDFSHNPFSMPQGGLEALNTKDPLDVYAYQYDLVCNGYEMASGAVRNHDPEIMVKAFEIAGYTEEDVKNRFGALYNAFQYGTPPHAGAAPGIDRMVMLIADSQNIREVIAFPKNKRARDLLMRAPSVVSKQQLKDVHIKLDLEK